MNKDNAERQFDLAVDCVRQKKFQEARRALELALALHLSPPVGWYFRFGRICESCRDWAAARDAYLEGLSRHPNSVKCLFHLGQVEFRLNNFSAAEEAYRQALTLDASNPDWHGKLGLCLKAQGRSLEAIQAFKKALPLYALQIKQGNFDCIVSWANALYECGLCEDGLAALVRNAKALDQVAGFESVLSLLTDALGEKGEIHLALESLLQIRQVEKLEVIAVRQYLKLCVKYAYFEDTALDMALGARSIACTDIPSKEAALSLSFLYFGSSLGLIDEMLAVIDAQQKLNRSFALHVASMLFRLGEYERLENFCWKHPQLWVFCGETPALAYFVAHAEVVEISAEQKFLAIETLAAYESVRQAEHDIWEKVSDSNFSVAIVGNSSCEKGRRRGVEIDGHDIVFRFNNFSLDDQYNDDYGRKVDVVVRAGVDKEKYNFSQKSKDIVISGIRALDKYNSWGLVRRLISEGHRVCFYPQDLQQQLIRKIRRSPSAGLTTAWIAHKKREKSAKTSCYGFSFLDQTGSDSKSSHYFEDSKPSGRHEWRKEALVFEEITRTDMRVPLVQSLPKGRSIKLLGDHSSYHAGCAAVIDYLMKEVQEVGFLCSDENYDILIVNGEGSMHHDSKNHKAKMAAIENAVGRGKRVYLINTVWQSNGPEHDHVLRCLDGISVREQMSHDDLLARHGVESVVSLDVSYWADVDAASPFRDMQRAVVVGDFYSKEFGTFVKFTGGPLQARPYIDMSEFTWSELVNTLRTASLLVTGRHHAVFAACRARTSFVAMQGNTHKIEGMIQMSGLPIPVCKTPSELSGCIGWARKNRSVYEEFFSWMDAQPRFRLGEFAGMEQKPRINSQV